MARRTETDPKTRRDILEGAIQVIASEGIRGLTIQKAAKAAGVSSGLVIYYFATKDDLIAQAWVEALAAMRAQVNELTDEPGGRTAIATAFKVYFDDKTTRKLPWSFWLELWAEATRSPRLKEFHSHRFATNRSHFAAKFQDGFDRKQFVGPIEPTLVADLLKTLIYGLAVETTLDSDSIDSKRAMAIVGLVLDLLEGKYERTQPATEPPTTVSTA